MAAAKEIDRDKVECSPTGSGEGKGVGQYQFDVGQVQIERPAAEHQHAAIVIHRQDADAAVPIVGLGHVLLHVPDGDLVLVDQRQQAGDRLRVGLGEIDVAAPDPVLGALGRVLVDPDRLRVVDGLLTGLHQPGESHFELLQAFARRDLLERALDHAARAGYRSHEFGDASLILAA